MVNPPFRTAVRIEALVDIHSHILPGLDDGAKSMEESVAMVKMAAESGTTDIVATPHANDRYAYDPAAVRAGVGDLQAACGGGIRIHWGCDFHMSYGNVQDALRYPAKYTIDGESYLLIEFSDMAIAPNTSAVLDQLLSVGIIPIVTHPERNPILQKKLSLLVDWVQRDCLVQVTAGSFLGRFGRAAARAAGELMERNLVHVVASDAHDLRHRTTALDGAYEYIVKHYSLQHAETLFLRNPWAVVLGESVDSQGLLGMGRKAPLWRRLMS
jgi:protein-tyrosine phosphatase